MCLYRGTFGGLPHSLIDLFATWLVRTLGDTTDTRPWCPHILGSVCRPPASVCFAACCSQCCLSSELWPWLLTSTCPSRVLKRLGVYDPLSPSWPLLPIDWLCYGREDWKYQLPCLKKKHLKKKQARRSLDNPTLLQWTQQRLGLPPGMASLFSPASWLSWQFLPGTGP